MSMDHQFVSKAGKSALAAAMALAMVPVSATYAVAEEDGLSPDSGVEQTGGDEAGSLDSSQDDESAQVPEGSSTAGATVATSVVALQADSAAADSLDWEACGTCEWAIDDNLTLIVRPANGAESGELDSWLWGGSPWANTPIVSAVFQGAIKANLCYDMFEGCESLETLDLTGLDTSEATMMNGMFSNCVSLKSVTVGDKFRFDVTYGLPLGYWASSVDGVAYESDNVPSLIAATYTKISTDEQNRVYRCGTCEWIVDGNWALTVRPMAGQTTGVLSSYSGPYSPWENLPIVSVEFEGRVQTSEEYGINGVWFQDMFSGCSLLKSADLTGLDNRAADGMSGMFSGCDSLVTVKTGKDFTFEKTGGLGGTGAQNPGGIHYWSFWLSSSDGVAYSGSDMPSFVEAVYTKIEPGAAGLSYRCGTCEWIVDGVGSLVVRPTSGASKGELEEWAASPWSGLPIVSVKFEGSVVVPTASRIFENCSKLESVDFSGADFSQAQSCYSMFSGCTSLNSIDLSRVDLSNVVDFSYMFYDCSLLESIDLTGIDMLQGAQSSWMFSGCNSLRSIKVGEGFSFDAAGALPSEHWLSSADGIAYEGNNMPSGVAATYTSIMPGEPNRVYRCGTCEWVIDDAKALTVRPIADTGSGTLADWTTGSYYGAPWSELPIVSASFEGTVEIPSPQGLFSGCSSLESVDLSGLDTTAARDMSNMFSGCSSLKSVDVSGLDTSKVTNFQGMFQSCLSLESLDLSSFDTSKATQMGWMFGSCSGLRSVTLGDKFTFEGAGFYRQCELPDYQGSDFTGLWEDVATGKVYFPSDVPSGHAATYVSLAYEDVDGFPDVTSSTDHSRDILWLSATGISAGFPDDTFRPMNTVVRQDMAAFLYRLAGSPDYTPTADDKAKFSDVTDQTDHAKEIWWLASTGISTGYPDGTFRPMDTVVRQDMAAFLHRLGNLLEAEDPSSGSGVSFWDVSASTDHYEDILWLASTYISTGYPDGSFRPMESVYRQDMAAFLHRLSDYADR